VDILTTITAGSRLTDLVQTDTAILGLIPRDPKAVKDIVAFPKNQTVNYFGLYGSATTDTGIGGKVDIYILPTTTNHSPRIRLSIYHQVILSV